MHSWLVILIWAPMILVAMSLIRWVTKDPLRSQRTSSVGPLIRNGDYIVLAAMLALPAAHAAFTFSNGYLLSFHNLLYPSIVLAHWWSSVRSMSRAGVNSQLHRTLVTVVAIPLVWVGAYGLATSLVILGAAIYTTTQAPIPSEWLTQALLMCLVLLGFVLLLVAARKYIAWVYCNRGTVASVSK